MRTLTALGFAAALLAAASGIARADTLYVPTPDVYPTIQSAVDAAHPGDWIIVRALPVGSAYAPVSVPADKAGIKLIGVPDVKDQHLPRIDAEAAGWPGASTYGIEVEANGVRVQGFDIGGFTLPGNVLPGAGILVNLQRAGATWSQGTVIGTIVSGNNVSDSQYGIVVLGPSNPSLPQSYTITGNTTSDNLQYGIDLESSDGTASVAGNQCENNGWGGIYLYAANGCTVSGNTVVGNGATAQAGSAVGIGLVCSGPGQGQYTNGGSIVGDTISGNQVSGNTGVGISLFQVSAATVAGNTVEQTHAVYDTRAASYLLGDGILLQSYTTKCQVTVNTVNGNDGVGIHLDQLSSDLYDTTGNTMTYNTATGNHLCDAQDDVWKNTRKAVNKWRCNTFGTYDPAFIQ